MVKIRNIVLAFLIGLVFSSCENPSEYGGLKKKEPIDNPPKVNLELVYAKIEENGRLGYFDVQEYYVSIDTNQYDCNVWLNISLINKEQINYNYFYPLRLRSLDIKVDSLQANGIPFLINRSDSNFAKFKIVNAPPDRDTTIYANEYSSSSDISFGWNKKEKHLWAFFYAKIVCFRQRVIKADTSILVPSIIKAKANINGKRNNPVNLNDNNIIKKNTLSYLFHPYLDSLYIRGKFLFKLKS